MSNRKGLIAQAFTSVEPIPEPNRHIPTITADCRVYFPPNATHAQIVQTLDAAIADMLRQIWVEELPR
jgi:hypothetical protein